MSGDSCRVAGREAGRSGTREPRSEEMKAEVTTRTSGTDRTNADPRTDCTTGEHMFVSGARKNAGAHKVERMSRTRITRKGRHNRRRDEMEKEKNKTDGAS